VPGLSAPSVDDQIEGSFHLTERLNALFPIIIAGIDRLDDLRVLENQSGLQ
jgi:hypothetical protein